MLTSKPVHVLHLLGNLGKGGAEIGVVRLIEALSGPEIRHSIAVIGADRSLLDEYPLDVPCHILGLQKSYTAFWTLTKLVRREKVDLVHVNNLAPWLDAALAAKLSGVRCLQTFHGVEEGRLQFSFPRKLLLRLADFLSWRVTAVAEEAAALCSHLIGLQPERILSIPNGIDTRLFAPVDSVVEKVALRQTLGLPQQGVLFGCVAALRPVKNHRGLLHGFAAAIEQTEKPVSLVLVGDGPLLQELQSLASDLHIADRVFFLGRRTDVLELLKCFDAFVLNSDTEGLSYAVLEAMASGLPFVGTAVGANTSLVSDGVEGFLAEPGKVDSIELALRRAIEKSIDLCGMGIRARQKVVQEYGIAAMANHYRDLYCATRVKK